MKKQSVFRWPGNKDMLLKRILPCFPVSNFYCEPFCGSLSVFLNLPHLPLHAVLNDINGDIVNFWQVVRNRSWELEQELKYQFIGAHEERGDDIVQRAAHFYLSHQNSTAYISTPVYSKNFDDIASIFNKSNAIIENRDALYVIRNIMCNNWFIYCDPPYPNTSPTGRNIYTTDFDLKFLYDTLIEKTYKSLINSRKGIIRWAVSINTLDCVPKEAFINDLGDMVQSSLPTRREYLITNYDIKLINKTSKSKFLKIL
jgi:site-specific DNA-adenine methylase